MAILDNIFNKKKNPTTSFLPVNEQEMQEEANRMPDIPETRASDVEDKQPAEMVTPQQEATPIPNKWGYSDSEMSALTKAGYTPDKLDQIANFDPAKGNNYLQHLYESTATKPTAPDDKKVRNARLWASIADSVGLLSQMYTYSKGAHVEKRDYKNSALSQVNADAKEDRDRYTKLSQMYDDGLLQARMKDYLKALDDYNNDRKGVQGVLAAKQKIEEAARQADQKNQYNYYKLGADQANKDRDFALKQKNQENMDRHRKAMEAQGWARVADSKSRTTAYVKKLSSGSGTNKNYQMIFAANPNDPDAVKDNQLGTSVRKFEMNKGEIDRYAREARADKNFMAKHPELTIKSKGLLGNDTEKLRPNEDIAAAWIEEQYSNSFTQTPAIPSMATQPFMNWGQMVQPNWMPNYTTPNSYDEEIEMPEEEDEEFPSVGNIANF